MSEQTAAAARALGEQMYAVSELRDKQFPPLVAHVEGLVYEGLTVVSGKPKVGKSWWALQMAGAVATGGKAFSSARMVHQGDVLYLALEDGQRRIQRRWGSLSAGGPTDWPLNLRLIHQWPRLDQGGIEQLEGFAGINDLIVIDTLARVRKPARGRDRYQEDSDALAELHSVAHMRPGLSIVVLHHNRKDDHPEDFIDAISGSTGISGVADHIAVIQRGRGEADAVLRFTSRDADEQDIAFVVDRGHWIEVGDARLFEQSSQRREVLAALDDLGGEARLTDIAEAVGKDTSLVRRMLASMESEDLVHQTGPRGTWKHGPNDPISPNTDPVLDHLD